MHNIFHLWHPRRKAFKAEIILGTIIFIEIEKIELNVFRSSKRIISRQMINYNSSFFLKLLSKRSEKCRFTNIQVNFLQFHALKLTKAKREQKEIKIIETITVGFLGFTIRSKSDTQRFPPPASPSNLLIRSARSNFNSSRKVL